jgi:hypothetical protein
MLVSLPILPGLDVAHDFREHCALQPGGSCAIASVSCRQRESPVGRLVELGRDPDGGRTPQTTVLLIGSRSDANHAGFGAAVSCRRPWSRRGRR